MDYNLRIVTYNINDQKPGNISFSSLLGVEGHTPAPHNPSLPDMIAIGLQEVKTCEDEWTKTLCEELDKHAYILAHTEIFNQTLLLFWCKTEHRHRILDVKPCKNLEGHKAVALTMVVMPGGLAGAISKGVRLTLICTHLMPHMEFYDLRCEQYKQILKDIDFGSDNIDNDILKHDYVIWFGDVNFRINDYTGEEVKERVDRNWHAVHEMKEKDQLMIARKSKAAFSEFNEDEITFHPTYKMFNGTDEYNLQRVPSWTDRILYRQASYEKIDSRLRIDKNFGYRCLFKYKLSDHKPVFASFVFHAWT
jgi:hypothetical protein